MKQIIKRIFANFGMELRRLPEPVPELVGEPIKMDEVFVTDDEYRIAFKRVSIGEDKYFAPVYGAHRPAVQKIINGEFYEPDTHRFVEFFCAENVGAMIHAGTFFGDMVPNFAKFCNGTVYAFEPVLENYVLARRCVESNRLENVILFNSALGQEISNLYINSDDGSGQHAGGSSKIDAHGAICTAMSIDTLELPELVLIQLDVEGFELTALEGARKTIQRTRPVIAIEDNSGNCAPFLADVDYVESGKIPGLSIWCPGENQQYQTQVAKFFASA